MELVRGHYCENLRRLRYTLQSFEAIIWPILDQGATGVHSVCRPHVSHSAAFVHQCFRKFFADRTFLFGTKAPPCFLANFLASLAPSAWAVASISVKGSPMSPPFLGALMNTPFNGSVAFSDFSRCFSGNAPAHRPKADFMQALHKQFSISF